MEKKTLEFFKTSLKRILKHPDINTVKINNVVKYVIHNLHFLKFYTVYHYCEIIGLKDNITTFYKENQQLYTRREQLYYESVINVLLYMNKNDIYDYV
jgi:hypothetical protein